MDTFIGDSIRAKREAAGLTQAQLAERAGLMQSAVSEIETGKRREPRYSTIQKLLAAIQAPTTSQQAA